MWLSHAKTISKSEYWSESNSIRNNDNELQKNVASFQTYKTDV